MLDVSSTDPALTGGATSEFLTNEILRVGASAGEVKTALAFVASAASLDPRAYDALSPRLRRLVDLVGVAGSGLPDAIVAGPAALSNKV